MYLNGLIHEDMIPLPQRSAALHICGNQRGILTSTCIGAHGHAQSCPVMRGVQVQGNKMRLLGTWRSTLLDCLLPGGQAIILIEAAIVVPGGLMDLTK